MTYGWDEYRNQIANVKGVPGDSCHCVGPQPGYPRCPCMMRGLVQRDGRWIQPEQDLGPVITHDTKEQADG